MLSHLRDDRDLGSGFVAVMGNPFLPEHLNPELLVVFLILVPGGITESMGAGPHTHVVVLYKLARSLVPSSRATAQAMLAVAVGTIFLAAAEFAIWMATLAGRIYLFGRIHNIRRRDIVFIRAMSIRRAVAVLAADISLRVHGRELIDLVVYMAYIAPTVIG